MKGVALAAAGALLAAVAGGGPAAERPSPGPGWVLVQVDGARVVLQAPPEARDGKLVGRLAGTGTLVSVPEARVDAEATRAANAARPGSPARAAAPRRTAAPLAAPSLGDVGKLARSPEEVRRILESAAKRDAVPAPSPPPGAMDATATAEPPAAKDREGRGEAYWRERAAAARGVLETAQRELAAAEAELRAAERSFLGVGEAERNSFIIRVIEARDVAERARAEHQSASGRWEALQEEARKAGAFPGWLR